MTTTTTTTTTPLAKTSEIIDAATTMGAVSLSVADLARSIAYYTNSIGLAVLARTNGEATLGAGKTPLLHLREVRGAKLVRGATGLYHLALLVPTRHDLARVIQHFMDSGTQIGGASDHTVSEALYLSDPDGHGIEIYSDRPKNFWFDAQGNPLGSTDPLDMRGMLSEMTAHEPAWAGLPAGTVMGHVHLQVSDIAAAERFYLGVLGFELVGHMPSASFVSAGRYHHHIGMNTWAGVGVPPPPKSAARLLSFEVVLPNRAALDEVTSSVRAAGLALSQDERGWTVLDPSQNLVVLRSAL